MFKQIKPQNIKADKDELESICYSNDHNKQDKLINKHTITDINQVKTGLQRFINRYNKTVKIWMGL